jgi:hypothetical protein
MTIKMPIAFHGNYVLSIRLGEEEARERCQKLTVRDLTAEERQNAYEGLAEQETPTHQVTFYDFGCKRIIEGRLKVNEPDRMVFAVRDKEYAFSPFKPREQSS